MARDAEHLLEATADEVSENAKDAPKQVAAAVERVKTLGEERRERGLMVARNTAKEAEEIVRANPYQSIGVAFGIGLLIGLLARRK